MAFSENSRIIFMCAESSPKHNVDGEEKFQLRKSCLLNKSFVCLKKFQYVLGREEFFASFL
jgi:hypothetical protein